MEHVAHPTDPRSNISKFSGYEADKYIIKQVSPSVRTSECLTPGRPPCQTQNTIGKYLVPTTFELDEVAPTPSIAELPQKVIDHMVKKDKAFWVDKPGANAYTLHDAFYNYGMTTEVLLPTPQCVFPRSYQYDLDCVRYRRLHACDGLNPTKDKESENNWEKIEREIQIKGRRRKFKRDAICQDEIEVIVHRVNEA